MLKRYINYIADLYSFIYGEKVYKKILQKHQILKFVIIACIIAVGIVLILLRGVLKPELIALVMIIGIIAVVPDLAMVKKAEKKRESLKYGLADFMDRVAILLDSGMPLWSALSATAMNSDSGEPFTAEMQSTVQAFSGSNGYYYRPEEHLEQLADRCLTLAVSSFVSLVIQNSRKGSEELASIFKSQAMSCRTEQRNMAKKRAEEASTLMLIPTAVVFVAILAMVATPAVFTVISGLSV